MAESITYTDSLNGVTAEHLTGGFFAGWPNPPSPATHLRILQGSSAIGLARITGGSGDGNVVGYITAISDGISCLYIPHLEVLATHQRQGIGTHLVQRILQAHRHLYMLDLICDADLVPFYTRLGMQPVSGMIMRNYERQHCGPT